MIGGGGGGVQRAGVEFVRVKCDRIQGAGRELVGWRVIEGCRS